MKKILSFFSIYLFCAFTFLHAQLWEDVNNGTSNCQNINAVAPVTGSKIIASQGGSSSGSFIVSNDSGLTWESRPTPQNRGIYDIHFVNENLGIGVGNGIIRTEDGGENWEVIIPNNLNFRDVDFFNDEQGYAIRNSSQIFYTNDGGLTWETQSSSLNNPATAIENIGQNLIVVALRQSGTSGNQSLMARSVNNGQSFTNTFIVPHEVKDLHFPTPSLGYGVGDFGLIIKTENGGQTWTANTITNNHFTSVSFLNETTGYATTDKGEIFKTQDGGDSWQSLNTDIDTYLADIYVNTNGKIYSVGRAGVTLTSFNQGTDWDPRNTGDRGLCNVFRAVYTFDDENAVVCGSGIFWTENGGQTWNPSDIPTPFGNFYNIWFINDQTGFAVGSGLTLRSDDSGRTWQPVAVNGSTGIADEVHFAEENPNVGYYVMQGGGVMKTTDGGWNWNLLPDFTNNCLSGIHVINPDEVWVTGSGGFMAHSTDGGQTWNAFQHLIDSSYTVSYHDVFFTNDLTGFFVGGNGEITRTTDGGLSFEQVSVPYSGGNFYHIHFPDEDNGWISGQLGQIISTSDGGNTWVAEITNSSDALRGIHFSDAFSGYTAGNLSGSGAVLKTKRGASLCLQDGIIGPTGTTALVAVTGEGLTNISSFQMTIRSTNPAAIVPVDTAGFDLPGQLIRHTGNGYMNLLWTNNNNCVTSFADGDTLFFIEVDLTGIPGECGELFFDDSPVPTKVYKWLSNSDFSVPLVTKSGEVCLAAATQVCGTVENPSGGEMEFVRVNVHVLPSTGTTPFELTNGNGDYCVGGIFPGSDIFIEPEFNNPNIGEIDVDDLAVLENFVNGIIDLNHPWQKIAGDINNNGTIDEDDLDDLVNMILVPTAPVPNNNYHVFIPKSEYPIPFDQTPDVPAFTTFLPHNDVAADLFDQDFIGIAVGDLNGSVNLNSAVDRSAKKIALVVEKEYSEAENQWIFNFKMPDFAFVNSFQTELVFDSNELEFESINAETIAQFGIFIHSENRLKDGKISLLWTRKSAALISEYPVLFSLVFKVKTNLLNEPKLEISEQNISSIAYQDNAQSSDFQLIETDRTFDKVTLFNPQPNPWNDATLIQTFVPENIQNAELSVLNQYGSEVRTYRPDSGNQITEIVRGDLPNGIYYVILKIENTIQARLKTVIVGK